MSLFYADDLVLLSSTEQGLQQQLDIVEKYCKNWALAVNMKTANVMIFQKYPSCQENKYQFTINEHVIEHSMSYTYLQGRPWPNWGPKQNFILRPPHYKMTITKCRLGLQPL